MTEAWCRGAVVLLASTKPGPRCLRTLGKRQVPRAVRNLDALQRSLGCSGDAEAPPRCRRTVPGLLCCFNGASASMPRIGSPGVHALRRRELRRSLGLDAEDSHGLDGARRDDIRRLQRSLGRDAED